jgi:hypothetical protein
MKLKVLTFTLRELYRRRESLHCPLDSRFIQPQYRYARSCDESFAEDSGLLVWAIKHISSRFTARTERSIACNEQTIDMYCTGSRKRHLWLNNRYIKGCVPLARTKQRAFHLDNWLIYCAWRQAGVGDLKRLWHTIIVWICPSFMLWVCLEGKERQVVKDLCYKDLCYKPEGRGFETWWDEWILSIYLILPGAVSPGIHSASNRNEYQKQKNSFSGQ